METGVGFRTIGAFHAERGKYRIYHAKREVALLSRVRKERSDWSMTRNIVLFREKLEGEGKLDGGVVGDRRGEVGNGDAKQTNLAISGFGFIHKLRRGIVYIFMR